MVKQKSKQEFTVRLSENDKATLFFDDEVAVYVGRTYIPLDLNALLEVRLPDGDEEMPLIESLIEHLEARLARLKAKIEAEND